MNVKCDEMLRIGWFPHGFDPPKLCGVLVAKLTLKLCHGAIATPLIGDDSLPLAGETYVDDDPFKEILYANDFVPRKARMDVLLHGTAYAPNSRPVESFDVSIQVGNWSKSLRVFGDREWQLEPLSVARTKPLVLAKLPLSYSRSFGGPQSKWNSVGIGHGTTSGPLPSIEDPNHLIRQPSDSIPPAGFGPLSQHWKPRVDLRGTYDDQWKKHRWPWLPTDFDYGYFNAAPEDQQFKSSLKGDEWLVFRNLHPTLSEYRTQLPGMRARCFVSKLDDSNGSSVESWSEISMVLDTLCIDMDKELATVLWRGEFPIQSLRMLELNQVLGVVEPTTSRAGASEAIQACLLKHSMMEQEHDEDLKDAQTSEADLEADLAELDAEMAQGEADADAFEKDLAKQLVEYGVDPKLLQEPPPQSLTEMAGSLKSLADSVRTENPELAGIFDEEAQEMVAMDAEIAADAENEPTELTREIVEAMAQRKESFSGLDLSGLELHELDLSGLDFSNADLSESFLDGCNLTGCNFAGAELSGADLSDAELSGANLDHADLSECVLEDANLEGVSLNSTILSGLELQGLNFSSAKGFGVDFSGSNLTGAQFQHSKLPNADFSGSTLENADFHGADLEAAQFEKVKARGLRFTDAQAVTLHASSKSDFTGADFSRSNLSGSVWEEAILDNATFLQTQLPNALFPLASFKNAVIDRADMRGVSLEDANLSKAKVSNTNLLRAALDRAELNETVFHNCNLYNAGFWETQMQHVEWDGCNLKGTVLS